MPVAEPIGEERVIVCCQLADGSGVASVSISCLRDRHSARVWVTGGLWAPVGGWTGPTSAVLCGEFGPADGQSDG